MQLRVVFAGTPAFALPPLAALHAQHRVVGVLTQPDRPAGRGRVLTASLVKQAAERMGVPVQQPRRLRGEANELEATLAWLHSLQPDVIVVVAYGLILPAALLQWPRLGCLNIHASLLPRWRGAAPIQRAILAGDAETGVCIMQMDEGLDTGAVLAQAKLHIGAEITSAQLHDQLAELGAAQIVRAVNELNEGRAQAIPQPSQGVTYAEKLSKAEARVNWHHDAAQIDRQIRAFNPWPVAETTLGGEMVKLLRSRASASGAAIEALPPGTVAGLYGDALAVACGRGMLQVTELQRAGRKPVTAREFLNAARSADGAPLVFQ